MPIFQGGAAPKPLKPEQEAKDNSMEIIATNIVKEMRKYGLKPDDWYHITNIAERKVERETQRVWKD